MIRVKRVYESPSSEDGVRILVDGVWPRGKKRESLLLDEWIKALAPSKELRKWFGHRVERWDEFVRSYKEELADEQKQESLQRLRNLAEESNVTLLYSAKDAEHNQAIVLKDVLENRCGTG